MKAARKAFIVTRFADLGLLLGVLILSNQAGTLDFMELIARLSQPGNAALTVGFMGASALSWGLALVFMGAAGKSAMFPLHIWLPDAMEGPTPVSALIHAATMVVAGVFLVARLYPVYAYSGSPVLEWVGYIGVFTALFAALIATTQTDIKRVLAYSTISQIGFMMFALAMLPAGASVAEGQVGFTASMFHLFTHAIFKALLFLGAGAVIHYVHSNEMKEMGGLRKYMPVTHAMFLIACLAIAGIPPFAGFFSKEEILLAAWENNRIVYFGALLTSGLTAFYMFRLYFSIFWQKAYHPHGERHTEGDVFLLTPLVILSMGSVLAGFLPFGEWISSNGKPLHLEMHLTFSIAPVAIGLLGILIAARMYRKENNLPEKVSNAFGSLYRSAANKFYIDEIWTGFTRRVLFNAVARPIAWADRHLVDGIVKGTGTMTEWFSWKIKGLQSGKVQQYGIFFLLGIIIILSFYLFRYMA
jgi:NADH-quinone oxidoreductase subunit L